MRNIFAYIRMKRTNTFPVLFVFKEDRQIEESS